MSPSRPFRAFTARHLDQLGARAGITDDQLLELQAVASVLPFRTNSYVLEELIDWTRVPEDPIFRLTFPQAGMLSPADLAQMVGLLRGHAPPAEIRATANKIRMQLAPHPDGQLELNTPILAGQTIEGMQHKYHETLLVFPRQGQTCHAYCTYCFRWPQFVGEPDLRIATNDILTLRSYLLAHPEIVSVLITGGDPMVMSAPLLARYVEPLLDIESIESVRIGTKAISYWPYRFVTDTDASDVLRLFEQVVRAGKHLALMAHVSHVRELEPSAAQDAIRLIQGTGAVVRCQAPLIRGINDDPRAWIDMWRQMTRLGAIPYYMFIERDTGPKDYFAVPLARAYAIFRDAYAQVSGLARTVRGPIMSATPGKVSVDGFADVGGERVFVLSLVQARDPSLVGRPFFARFDDRAAWLSDLVPVGERNDLTAVFDVAPVDVRTWTPTVVPA